MDKSLYKDTLDFFYTLYDEAPQGNKLKRLRQFVGMIVSCFGSKQCSVESLCSKNQACKSKNKNSLLQNSKRFFKNKWVDYETYFQPLVIQILLKLAKKGELIFVIDGTQIGNHTALMISVLWKKRSIPIIWTLRKGEKGHFAEEMHVDLVKELAKIVPSNCRCVFLGDGEFDGFELRKECLKHKWEFVLRTIKNRKITLFEENARADEIYPFPGEQQWLIPDAVDGINLVCWHNPRYESPIFLLTNMDLGEMACIYYQRRFEIENMFKRMKSQGYKIDKTQMQQTDRINRLIMIACASYILLSELGRFIKEELNPDEIKHIVCKDRLPRMTYIRLAWTCLKEDLGFALSFFSYISMNFDWFFT